ncbi:MAG: sulfur oxidation c-type cytochrome SoxX [Rhodospirillales bacterium]|nr:sulfur oxidation c-type cytochrome SoxX [Rhodospirillales bacterium]
MMRGVVLALMLALLPASAFAADAADIAAGQRIAFDRALGNCLACHVIAGGDQPGDIGPPLSGMKVRFPKRQDLFAIIANEQARNPQTIMPPFGRNDLLTTAQINQVIDFLYTK